MPAQTPKGWEWRQRQFRFHLIWVYPFDQALFKQMVRSQWLTLAWSDPLRYFAFVFRIVFLWFPALFLMNPFLPTDLISVCLKMYVSIWLYQIWNDFLGGVEWPHLLTFFLDRPIKSNWSRSEDAYLAYLSLPPRKVAPPFPTWGWMHGGSLCRIKSRFS